MTTKTTRRCDLCGEAHPHRLIMALASPNDGRRYFMARRRDDGTSPTPEKAHVCALCIDMAHTTLCEARDLEAQNKRAT